MNLLPDWRLILRRAWSMRLMAVAILLTIAEALLPLVDWLPDLHYAGLSVAVIVAAMVARVVAQKDIP